MEWNELWSQASVLWNSSSALSSLYYIHFIARERALKQAVRSTAAIRGKRPSSRRADSHCEDSRASRYAKHTGSSDMQGTVDRDWLGWHVSDGPRHGPRVARYRRESARTNHHLPRSDRPLLDMAELRMPCSCLDVQSRGHRTL
jgi:hypothetical protein